MQEQVKEQHVPVKVYRTNQRLMVAAPMAGLEPENMVVEVTAEDHLILHGGLRGRLKEVKELLLDEWSVGVYHRELILPVAVNARCVNVTYGNGVLMNNLADQPKEPSSTTVAPTTRSYSRPAQRQYRTPSHLCGDMTTRLLDGSHLRGCAQSGLRHLNMMLRKR